MIPKADLFFESHRHQRNFRLPMPLMHKYTWLSVWTAFPSGKTGWGIQPTTPAALTTANPEECL
jgi:hypothetical protein